MVKEKYYNEEYYLNQSNDNNMIKAINKRRLDNELDIVYDEVMYKENIKAYQEYIKLVAYLVKELSLPENAISQSLVLNMLIENGIIGNNNGFVYKDYYKEVKGVPGINVILGEGNCKHISYFNHDVLSLNKLYSDIFYGYLTLNYSNDIDNKKANYVINLIEYNDNLYGFDSKHNLLYRFTNGLKMEDAFDRENVALYYKPYMNMINEGLNVDNVNSLISIYEKMLNKKVISLDEFNYILKSSIAKINRNKELFREFENTSKKYIKKITNELK